MTKIRLLPVFVLSASFLSVASYSNAVHAHSHKPAAASSEAEAKCEHGVKKTICTRCNPKLKAAFKAKGDWCKEHDRPESQCAICHKDLADKGVKP